MHRAVDPAPDTANERALFWGTNQPGFKFATAPVGTREFYRQVEAHRYTLEPHILDIAEFGGVEEP